MNLQEIKNLKDQKGFTIVELLIVIVVIGILAAIVIVAFNGVQSRANKTAAEQAATQVAKKAEAYNAVNSAYPTSTTQFNSESESKLEGITLTSTLASGTGKTAVEYSTCSTGFRIRYWDYTLSTPGPSSYIYGGGATSSTTGCTVRS
jgi:prepilin-type N-terminal cleavage/methylation domain